MKSKLALSFPWVVLAFVFVMIVLDQYQSRSSEVLSLKKQPISEPLGEKDPVCLMDTSEGTEYAWSYQQKQYYFCNPYCLEQFQKEPEKWLNSELFPSNLEMIQTESHRTIARDPVCNMDIAKGVSHHILYHQENYYFCTTFCRDAFKKEPEKWLQRTEPAGSHLMHGIPSWMYQFGVAIILLISFGLFEVIHWVQEKRNTSPQVHIKAMEARLNVSTWKPLHRLLKWEPFIFVLRFFFVICFLTIIAAGLFGNQNPAMNIAPLLTWTIWWVGLIFVILYFGKAWCTVCPWDAIATWMERLKFWGPRKSGLGLRLKWPKSLRNIWLAVFLFIGLTWLELGLGVTMIPRATAWLALLILGMAIVSAFLFDRKSFCRYGCLVGRISGLYAMFSSTELRVEDPKACSSCKTMDCYRGNEKGDGCPTFEFPKTMQLSTYCILCTECIKTCPKDNIVIRQRPWGADLVQEGKPRVDEAFLSIILLSMTGFHGLTMTPKWSQWSLAVENGLQIPSRFAFSLLMSLILIAPILIFWGLTWLSSLCSKRYDSKTFFIRYAYALLPIALFYHLAHNAEHFLMEGPKLIALISDPFGWGWNLFGTAKWTMTPLITLEGLWWIQIVFILIGHIYSLWISEQTTRRLIPDRKQAFLSQLPMLFAMVLFSIFSLWLVKQPMEMRISAM